MDNKINIHRELVARCKQGDRKAQFRIYELYAAAVLNTCHRIVRDEAEANDLMQDVFLKAFTQLEQYRGDATFGAWLKRIAVNTSINALKKRKVQFTELNENDEWVEEEEEEQLDEHAVETVRQTLLELPAGYRTVLSLYLLEGYDHNEIAEVLGITVSTSVSQFHRGKQKLRQLLLKKRTHGQRRAIL